MGVFGGEEEGGRVRSGPGEPRTLLLPHITIDGRSKQPLVVRAFLKVYMELCSYFLFLQEKIKDMIIIIIISHVLQCPPPRAQLCIRYCSNKQQHLRIHLSTGTVIINNGKICLSSGLGAKCAKCDAKSDNGDPLNGIIYCRYL